MSEHHATVHWARTSRDFTYDSYNRSHVIRFKRGDIALAGSAAPEFKGDSDRVDPEEAFVASLSSCHMLSFLAIAARKRLIVDSYEDAASGTLEKGPGNKLWMSQVTLRPFVRFAPETPVDEKLLREIHHLAHDVCFIANSVKTNVTVEPQG